MTILLITSSWYPSGGDWTYTKTLVDLFEERGDRVIPFAMQDERNFETPHEENFITNVNYNLLNGKKNLKNIYTTFTRAIYSKEAINKLRTIINENTIDVVHLQNIHNIHTLSIIPEIKKFNIPIIWRVLDYKIICPNRTFLNDGKICEACHINKYYMPAIKRCKKNSLSASIIVSLEAYFNYLKGYYQMIDLYSFQSKFSRDLFIKYGFNIKKTHISPNPYKISVQSYSAKREYVTYIGRISAEKGIKTLIQAMKLIPNINLKIIGDGPQKNELEEYVKNEKINNIKFEGKIWGEDLNVFLAKSLALIVPSEWYEPNPYVVLQAFELSVPVIASNTGGLTDMIQHDINGLLFDMGDEVDLAQTIKELNNSTDKQIELGKAGRKKLENYYNAASAFEDYYIELQNLLKRN